ncbi:MAG: PTS sugar transporter subunit IIB [Elusimicrobiota bacterium]|jgi:PTS system cellobiose-specific IIB component|nr:PTS sugar transporter subunit IIB [Elusimicrobiota bacterium]
MATIISIFCNAGMSTSIMVKKMQESAAKRSIDVKITAYPFVEINAIGEKSDIILLGPQMGFEEKRIKGLFDPKNIPVAVIPMIDYGMLNGEKVLDFALKLKK